jgi:hypothetical protein
LWRLRHNTALAANAAANRILPFHPGAIRFYAEAGIKLPSPTQP